ncbi:hypothetical protein BDQ94DRAFT_153258 [Aspergillus welwitschiae]|uniref:Uncharacterized protein n=1 Tax=Aspergillus welwitschiae TaxID=1341132 RepID=A0A3F3PLH8_9EURO|nr:uncharacterized protein BO96DRAFT_106596 [Aspergillus niger CBS 101883]XP_026620791.1 hypothetical protein BDQ94DRAFT_153258 [Aspergillus welwitschiae]PYH54407.1 hypothetical protein BO96DRAFT_106596 [Aspergillus niger CBS 101883]RDH27769.1 hypothetical protein BDQ94DRAFT_153258 [Aspergillus welwitschiae]
MIYIRRLSKNSQGHLSSHSQTVLGCSHGSVRSETIIDNHSTDVLTFLYYHCTIDISDRRVMLAYTTFPWLA